MEHNEEKAWPFWNRHPSVRRVGGIVDPGMLDEFHRMGCGWVRHFYRTALASHQGDEFADQFENITLFFMESSEVNAVAFERSGQRAVGVFTGTVRRLWWLFYTAANIEDIFDFWVESAPARQGKFSVDEAISDPVWPQATHDPMDWPQDRKEMLYDLFFRALDFLLYHELAHHARGHMEYVREVFGVSEIDEALNAASIADTAQETLRFIEFDADHFALDMILMAHEREHPLKALRSEQALGEYILQAVAIIGLFMLLDLRHTRISRQYMTSHPASVHRAMRLTSALAKTYQKGVGWTDDERLNAHDVAWWNASKIARALGLPEGRWHGDHTDDMDVERFRREEKRFLSFSRDLTQRIIAEEEEDS